MTAGRLGSIGGRALRRSGSTPTSLAAASRGSATVRRRAFDARRPTRSGDTAIPNSNAPTAAPATQGTTGCGSRVRRRFERRMPRHAGAGRQSAWRPARRPPSSRDPAFPPNRANDDGREPVLRAPDTPRSRPPARRALSAPVDARRQCGRRARPSALPGCRHRPAAAGRSTSATTSSHRRRCRWRPSAACRRRSVRAKDSRMPRAADPEAVAFVRSHDAPQAGGRQHDVARRRRQESGGRAQIAVRRSAALFQGKQAHDHLPRNLQHGLRRKATVFHHPGGRRRALDVLTRHPNLFAAGAKVFDDHRRSKQAGLERATRSPSAASVSALGALPRRHDVEPHGST